MTTFALKKTMPRELTSYERDIIKSYLDDNHLDESAVFIAEKFEKIFETPITETCITSIFVEMMINRGFSWR